VGGPTYPPLCTTREGILNNMRHMKKFFFFLIILIAAVLLWKKWPRPRPSWVVNAPLAMGAQGQGTQRKPLSPTQVQRLEKYLVEPPPSVPLSGSAVQQANSINQFNQKQTGK
jgi:hypothetical protein